MDCAPASAMDKSQHHRRSIRLNGADYTRPGAYFLTICTAQRKEIFGKIENERVTLNRLGCLVQTCLLQVPAHFPNAEMKEYVIMPNHVHMIVALDVGARYIVPPSERPHTPEGFRKPVRGSIPTIVRTLKAAVTRLAAKQLGWRAQAMWQGNYFERVLRDGGEYAKAARYSMENPMLWESEKENPQYIRKVSGTVIREIEQKSGRDLSCPCKGTEWQHPGTN